MLGELNWLAVIVATVVYFALGALWYAPPVFGNAWMRAAGTVMQEGERPGPAIYFTPLIGYFIAVIATAMLAAATGSTTLSQGIVLGLVVGWAMPSWGRPWKPPSGTVRRIACGS